MDYSVFVFILTLILIPITIGILASILFYIYDALTTSHKGSLKNLVSRHYLSDLKKKKNIFLQDGVKNSVNYVLFLYLVVSLLLTYLVADFLIFNTLNLKFDVIIILFCLIIPLVFTGINYTSNQLYRSSKEFFKTLLDYYIPIVLSLLSIFILLYSYGIELSELSIDNISSFQNSAQIRVFNEMVPALFLIINPFAAIAFFTSMMGLFRTYRRDFYRNNSINEKLFSKILRNICFFGIVLLFVFLFIGGGYFFDQNLLMNLIMCALVSLFLIIIISIIDYGRPKIFIDRKIWNSINIPLIFSILAVLYSIILLFVNFSFITLILN